MRIKSYDKLRKDSRGFKTACNEMMQETGCRYRIFDKKLNDYNPQLVLLPNGSVVENINSQSQFKRKLNSYKVEFYRPVA